MRALRSIAHHSTRSATGLSGEDQVDPHAATLVEVAGSVVPPRVHAAGVVVAPEHVDEAVVGELVQPRPLGFADVRGADELGRVVHVDVVGSDVEVAGDHSRTVGRRARRHVRRQPTEPVELVDVVLVVEGSAVRHVHARHPDAARSVAVMIRASTSGSMPSAKFVTTSSRPTFDSTATPFHWPWP